MKDFIDIYNNNKTKIEIYINESIKNLGNIINDSDQEYKLLFDTFISLELVYIIDAKTKKQISNNIFRNKIDTRQTGIDRSYLMPLDNNIKSDNFITLPYISGATQNTCITVVKQIDDEIIFMDFDLIRLLEKLKLIELNKNFDKITKSFYFLTGASMAVIAVLITLYAIFSFANNYFISFDFSVESMFKPIIAITLGIAIFDLAKTILEQEYFFKNYSNDENINFRVLTKFLTTIIIALSIEALMVVFKIAIDDYEKMIHALYLISGVSLIIISLSVFNYISYKK